MSFFISDPYFCFYYSFPVCMFLIRIKSLVTEFYATHTQKTPTNLIYSCYVGNSLQSMYSADGHAIALQICSDNNGHIACFDRILIVQIRSMPKSKRRSFRLSCMAYNPPFPNLMVKEDMDQSNTEEQWS